MQGMLLILHAACGPVLIICVAYWALSGSARVTFRAGEPFVRKCSKACYWLLLLLALPLTLSMVLSMFPWLGTQGQELFFGVHQYSAAAWVIVALVGCVMQGLIKSRH